MRPTPLLLALGVGAFLLSAVLAVAVQGGAAVVLVVWGVLGAALLADATMGRPSGGLSVAVDTPPEVFAGASVPLRLTVRDGRGTVPRDLKAKVDWPEGIEGPDEIGFDGPVAEPPLRGVKRGRWSLGTLALRWRGPLGLVEMLPSRPLDAEIPVVPDIRPVSTGEIDVMVRSTLFGVKENLAQGEGSEFHQLRDFTRGMDVRSIDWKRSASHRRLVAKETRAERNQSIVIAIDNGTLMREQVAGLPKIDHQINAALAVAWAAVQGGDRIGLLAFDARPRLFVPPEGGRAAFARMRTRMAGLEYRSVETNHTLAAATLQARLKRRSLLVILTDFVDTTSAELLLENVAILNRRHLVLFATLKDRTLAEMAAAAPGGMTDVARSVAAERFLQERREVLERLRRMGVLCVEAAPGELTGQLVSSYLQIKAREMI